MSYTTYRVLLDVANERGRQDEKWGQQSHPDGTSREYKAVAEASKRLCDARHKQGVGTWRDILKEEFHEAMAETSPPALRAELVQVAAVAVAWIEAIDRR